MLEAAVRAADDCVAQLSPVLFLSATQTPDSVSGILLFCSAFTFLLSLCSSLRCLQACSSEAFFWSMRLFGFCHGQKEHTAIQKQKQKIFMSGAKADALELSFFFFRLLHVLSASLTPALRPHSSVHSPFCVCVRCVQTNVVGYERLNVLAFHCLFLELSPCVHLVLSALSRIWLVHSLLVFARFVFLCGIPFLGHRGLLAFSMPLPLTCGADLLMDPVMSTHLAGLKDNLLEQNLIRVIEPFSKVEITHVAKLMEMPVKEIEAK